MRDFSRPDSTARKRSSYYNMSCISWGLVNREGGLHLHATRGLLASHKRSIGVV